MTAKEEASEELLTRLEFIANGPATVVVEEIEEVADLAIALIRAQSERIAKLEVALKEHNAIADKVSIYGMYDCNLFHAITGASVDQIIAAWQEHNASPNPAIVGERKVDDLGQSMLCPATVLCGKKELRRVGKMVFPESKTLKADIAAYRMALSNDPDIPQLLARQALHPEDKEGV